MGYKIDPLWVKNKTKYKKEIDIFVDLPSNFTINDKNIHEKISNIANVTDVAECKFMISYMESCMKEYINIDVFEEELTQLNVSSKLKHSF